MLFLGLDRNKPHVRPGCRLADRAHIVGIGLAAFDEGLNVIRRDQSHPMAQPFDLAAPMMRRRTRLESDFARRQRAEETQDLVARELPIEDLLFPFVDGANLEPALGDIQSNADDLMHDDEPFALPVEIDPLPPQSLNARGRAVHIISYADPLLLAPRPVAQITPRL
ncbi:hypothetical protein GCM10007874_40020 [Labrys miyagiensis]|uniref:Uncharacterized protein n=1 Tax=Labrys miyagiensis TaxID=346912 RepID=A0ABQ6CMC1_9HYPH|nr:hypothetical protein GCM10007874_40020 [Labrys miyagiensis]